MKSYALRGINLGFELLVAKVGKNSDSGTRGTGRTARGTL